MIHAKIMQEEPYVSGALGGLAALPSLVANCAPAALLDEYLLKLLERRAIPAQEITAPLFVASQRASMRLCQHPGTMYKKPRHFRDGVSAHAQSPN
ncbi:MAG: hypothetical protein JO083_02810 [Candidatus Eremiobacteraeota bacterium]|nr:hypothetical protein [Candidatus Eremiobacteraeota bacterium]